jgi:hypothetical protein
MSFYKKKPIVIEAWPSADLIWASGHDWKELPKFIQDEYEKGNIVFYPDHIFIRTLESQSFWSAKEDIIIKGIQNEMYSCKPDIFKKTYERVEEG